jgi:hypothetical protein
MYIQGMTEIPEKHPNWGGARKGAGRPSSTLKLSHEEARLLIRSIQNVKRDSPLAQLVNKLRGFSNSI